MRVRLPRLPLIDQNGSMVKRTSSLASNQKFRVRFLVGLLPIFAAMLAAGICSPV